MKIANILATISGLVLFVLIHMEEQMATWPHTGWLLLAVVICGVSFWHSDYVQR